MPAALATAVLARRPGRCGLALGDGEGRVPPGRTDRLRQPQRLDAPPGCRRAARRPDVCGARPGDRERGPRRNAAPRRLGRERGRDRRPRRAVRHRDEGREPLRARDPARADGDVRPGREVGAPARQGRHPARALPRLCHLAGRSRCGTRRRPDVPPPGPPAPGPPTDPTAAVRALQQRLADLSFLPAEAVDGKAGEQTRFAVIAFQKWQGLGRDGVAGPATQAALASAARPTPRTTGAGSRFEVLLDRQLTLYIENGTRRPHAARLLGRGRASRRRLGRYRVFRKEVELLVGPVQGVAAVGELLRRRRRLPRVARRPDAGGLARLRPRAALRREVGLRPRAERHAGHRARELR